MLQPFDHFEYLTHLPFHANNSVAVLINTFDNWDHFIFTPWLDNVFRTLYFGTVSKAAFMCRNTANNSLKLLVLWIIVRSKKIWFWVCLPGWKPACSSTTSSFNLPQLMFKNSSIFLKYHCWPTNCSVIVTVCCTTLFMDWLFIYFFF